MKKLLLTLTLLIALISLQKAQAITYEEAINLQKPMAILVYADWADDIDKVKSAFSSIEKNYSESYNFVYLNIANQDAKAFNKKFHIYPNLPYVLLFKDKGKISRYIQKSCVNDSACFSERLNFFLN